MNNEEMVAVCMREFAKAIKRSIPMTTMLFRDGKVDGCPVCKKYFDSKVNFCPRCGQAIDWGDSDE